MSYSAIGRVVFIFISTLIISYTPSAFAWWFFNDAEELVEKIDEADRDRRAAYDPRASVEERLEAYERAKVSTAEALNKTTEIAQEIPGTSLTGPPPTSKLDAAIEAVKEAAKWGWAWFWGEEANGNVEETTGGANNLVAQFNDSQFPLPPPDQEIIDSIISFGIMDDEDFLLNFDYISNPGFAPELFGRGNFSGVFSPICSRPAHKAI